MKYEKIDSDDFEKLMKGELEESVFQENKTDDTANPVSDSASSTDITTDE